MFAYKFYSHIGNDGKILIPEYLRNFSSNSVEIIMLVPEQRKIENNKYFFSLLKKYNTIDEPELEIKELYKNRNTDNVRNFDFT